MSTNVSIEELNEAIDNELKNYNEEITKKIKNQAKKSMECLVLNTKLNAPVGKRQKHYRDSITSKKTSETDESITYKWYVKGSDYRLSHLLENGHATKNGGRVEGTHFIKKATEPIIDEYIKEVKEILRNG